MKVQLSELKEKVNKGVEKLGYKGEDAQIISDVLMYAQMRGNNQGITKIATGGVPKASEVEEYKVVKQNKSGALVSGGHSMVATKKAADLAVELAGEHGVGIVGSNHTFTSSGAIGYFARSIAEQGYIGFVCVGNGSFTFVAPEGSSEPKLGTNPLSYAFPTNNGSVVFDTTTAAIAFFGIVEAKLKGEPLPKGIAFDSDGQPTTNAAKALDGSVSAFAQNKGYGLSLLVQLLGGPFVGASYAGTDGKEGSGNFVLAIDPGLLVDKDQFLEHSTKLVKEVKTAKPLEGTEEVLVPGERGDRIAKAAEETGEIEIADAVWHELVNFVEI